MSDDPTEDGTGTTAPEPCRGHPFFTTDWLVVANAGAGDEEGARHALADLCQAYWPPLYAYVRRAGYSTPDAQDLTQAFFARLLERNTVARADPARGRFRSFLLASLKHFLAGEWKKSRAQKRGGQVSTIPLPLDTAETRCAQVASPEDTPDRAFDRQWALALLHAVLGRLRREYADSGREELFLSLKGALEGGSAEQPQREIGARLGVSEAAVKAAAHRLRRRYRELLREEIARTVSSAAEVEEELRELFAALGD